MTDIEIPMPADRHGHYRFLEIMPWALSMSALALLIIISIVNVTLAAFFILLYIFVYVTRAAALSIRSLYGFRALRKNIKLNWLTLLQELEAGKVGNRRSTTKLDWHIRQIENRGGAKLSIRPSDLFQVIMIATYNESREVLEPTIQSVVASNFPMKQVILILAYEERGGQRVEQQAKELIETYKDNFYYAAAIKHPKDTKGEIIGKGGNITHAGRELQKYLEQCKIDPLRVVVTTLDADNHPDKQYLACLELLVCPMPRSGSLGFSTISMYTNNIWDAPAPMRVIATGNSIFNIVVAMRPHALRNFSSHAQGMASLIETNFWSTRTIVEDGHQFWRSYFRFDGHYLVYPLHVPIYQDAVLTESYRSTLKAQFIQLRRWTYGASDVAYVISQGFFKKNKVSKPNLIAKTFRLIEGHITWAVAPILVLVSGFVPVLFHPHSLAADQLPLIVSRVQTLALLTILGMLFLCLKTLPPKPERYKRHRTLFMVIQWVYLPFTTIIYYSFAAIYSQTRLAFGKYMGFDTTVKAVVSKPGK